MSSEWEGSGRRSKEVLRLKRASQQETDSKHGAGAGSICQLGRVGCALLMECLPSAYEALGFVPSNNSKDSNKKWGMRN